MAVTRISPDQYFAEENAREERAEYFDGRVVTMGGAGPAHERVLRDLAVPFVNHFYEGGCEPFQGGNTRVRAGNTYVYPDLVVACDPVFSPMPERLLLNPLLIADVLTPENQSFVWNRKSPRYREIDTLQEYVLIHANVPWIEAYRRVSEGWLFVRADGEDAVLRLTSLGFDLRLADVYRTRIKQGWPPDP